MKNYVIEWSDLIQHLYISGFCRVTLLGIPSKEGGKLEVLLNGYELIPNVSFDLRSPIWTPAALLEVKGLPAMDCVDKIDGSAFSWQCISMEEEEEMERDVNVSVFFRIEPFLPSDQNWLVAAEDQSVFRREGGISHSSDLLRMDTAAIGTSSAISQLGIDRLHFPLSWRNACQHILSHCTEVQQSLVRNPRIVICGSKGVGKSTCLRYLINRLLSHSSQCTHVCVLDCDVGQNEFHASGLVTLHVIDQPICTPAHLNLQTHLAAYYLGDITTRHEPHLLTDFVKSLLQSYETYCSEHPMQLIPLLVNCDGHVKYMGSEVHTMIMQLSSPQHVLHLCTPKNIYMPTIDSITQPKTIYLHNDLLSGITLEDKQNTKDASSEGNTCIVYSLEPGSISSVKIYASDLRLFKLLAYFLCESQVLKSSVRVQFDAGSSKSLLSAGFFIKNGTMVDNLGSLAISLLRIPPFRIPFRRVILGTVSNQIPYRLLPAAMNAAIVGIYRDNRTEATSKDSGITERFFALSQHSITFSIDCLDFPLNTNRNALDRFVCIGIGIIRNFDLKQQCLHLITPVNMSGLCKIALMKGNGHLLPTALLYSSLLPSLPYLSSESMGAGSSGEMNARTNLKRKHVSQSN